MKHDWAEIPDARLIRRSDQIDQIIGQSGKVNSGVYQFSIARAEKIMDNNIEVPPSMGVAHAINFQPTGGGKAAITGDFVLIASEVNPVIRALRENGIQVTTLHSHMLDETPWLFFMHFWANDDALKLARGIRAALDRTSLSEGLNGREDGAKMVAERVYETRRSDILTTATPVKTGSYHFVRLGDAVFNVLKIRCQQIKKSDGKHESIKRPISVPLSPLSAVQCYPCR